MVAGLGEDVREVDGASRQDGQPMVRVLQHEQGQTIPKDIMQKASVKSNTEMKSKGISQEQHGDEVERH